VKSAVMTIQMKKTFAKNAEATEKKALMTQYQMMKTNFQFLLILDFDLDIENRHK
jgi:hypothetical protein